MAWLGVPWNGVWYERHRRLRVVRHTCRPDVVDPHARGGRYYYFAVLLVLPQSLRTLGRAAQWIARVCSDVHLDSVWGDVSTVSQENLHQDLGARCARLQRFARPRYSLTELGHAIVAAVYIVCVKMSESH